MLLKVDAGSPALGLWVKILVYNQPQGDLEAIGSVPEGASIPVILLSPAFQKDNWFEGLNRSYSSLTKLTKSIQIFKSVLQ